MQELEGRTYGDRPFRVCVEKVVEFVAATGDDPHRWREHAPPGFAAVLLFVVAPELLDDPLLTGAVVHGEQSFVWSGPIPIEADLTITGTVDRVRVRGDTAFVTFSLLAANGGEAVVKGRSTFLVGSSLSPLPELPEIGVDHHGAATDSRARSASRADLVRYAAASRDWNPIHWDHRSAVDAGLGGIVVHGLLQSSWLTQEAVRAGRESGRVTAARFRFTSPLRPGQPARIEGEASGAAPELRLVADEVVTVSGRFQVET